MFSVKQNNATRLCMSQLQYTRLKEPEESKMSDLFGWCCHFSVLNQSHVPFRYGKVWIQAKSLHLLRKDNSASFH